MALSTLNSHAHEDLSDILCGLQRFGFCLVVVRGRTCERTTTRPQNLLNHFVGRCIAGDLFLQPVVVSQHWLLFNSICDRADLKQFGPFHHPNINEFFTLQKLIDQFFTLGRISIRYEQIVIFNRRHRSCNVHEHTTHEFFIAANF